MIFKGGNEWCFNFFTKNTYRVSFDEYEQLGRLPLELHNVTSRKVNTGLDLKMRINQQLITSL